MADIRINSLSTTASSTASNDFLAIDGATNGTRKLSAYNPNFGGSVTISGTGTYGALQLPSGTTTIYGIALGTDTNIWRTDAGSIDVGGSSAATINLNVGGTNKGYFYNNGTNTVLAGEGTLTLKSNGTTTGLTLDSGNATVGGTLTVSGTGQSSFASKVLLPGDGTLKWGDTANAGVLTWDTGKALVLGQTGQSLVLGGGSSGTRLTAFSGGGLFIGASPVDPGANNLSVQGNLTVSGGTVTSGTGTLTLNSSANTVVLQSAGTTALTLDSSQNVGIGTTAPKGRLHVWSNSAGTITPDANANLLILEDAISNGISILTPAGSSGQLAFGSPTDNRRGRIYYDHATDAMKFVTAGAGNIALTLDSSQNATFAGRVSANYSVLSSTQPGGFGASKFINDCTSNGGRIFSYGPNNSTAGTITIFQKSADESVGYTHSFDSSGNATFAGTIQAKGTVFYFGADSSQRLEITTNNGSSQGLLEWYNRGTSAYFAARYLASSHSFEGGPIAIANTVTTAAAVASTHKVTISIGGTTYYLLATNV